MKVREKLFESLRRGEGTRDHGRLRLYTCREKVKHKEKRRHTTRCFITELICVSFTCEPNGKGKIRETRYTCNSGSCPQSMGWSKAPHQGHRADCTIWIIMANAPQVLLISCTQTTLVGTRTHVHEFVMSRGNKSTMEAIFTEKDVSV